MIQNCNIYFWHNYGNNFWNISLDVVHQNFVRRHFIFDRSFREFDFLQFHPRSHIAQNLNPQSGLKNKEKKCHFKKTWNIECDNQKKLYKTVFIWPDFRNWNKIPFDKKFIINRKFSVIKLIFYTNKKSLKSMIISSIKSWNF